ncbi:hypothetical protein [Erwinia tracheiphila]
MRCDGFIHIPYLPGQVIRQVVLPACPYRR